MVRNIVSRGITGCVSGIVIGAVSAAMLISMTPQGWIETWESETTLEGHHLAWFLGAAIAGALILLSICSGGKQFDRSAAFTLRGILYGCLVATTLTLVAAWFNGQWPFRVKAPQTIIDIGRNYVLPVSAVVGGVWGRMRAQDGKPV